MGEFTVIQRRMLYVALRWYEHPSSLAEIKQMWWKPSEQKTLAWFFAQGYLAQMLGKFNLPAIYLTDTGFEKAKQLFKRDFSDLTRRSKVRQIGTGQARTYFLIGLTSYDRDCQGLWLADPKTGATVTDAFAGYYATDWREIKRITTQYNCRKMEVGG